MTPMLFAVLVATAVAAPAFAHTGDGAAHDLARWSQGLVQGFLHPLSGLDHVVAMVALGLYAAQRGGRALWLLPAAFVTTMALGGLLGYAQVPLPMVEQGIGLSVVAMGVAIALGLRLPAVVATALVAAFALFHGHAHGTEGTQLASFLPYAAGFAGATALLHAAGIAAGLAADDLGARTATLLKRAAGTAGALAGLVILAG